jgi:hypothetical protein
MPADIVYFAYGSNMFTPRLRFRVPGCSVVGRADLRGHALRWHKRSKDGSAKCNAMAGRPGDVVKGVLLAVPGSQLADLHKAEGRGYGYRDVLVKVRDAQNNEVEALTYLATADYIDETRRPYTWYWDFVLSGAGEHALPKAYVDAFMQGIVCDRDPDPERERAERAKVRGLPHHG